MFLKFLLLIHTNAYLTGFWSGLVLNVLIAVDFSTYLVIFISVETAFYGETVRDIYDNFAKLIEYSSI